MPRLRDAVLAIRDIVPESTGPEGELIGGGPVVPSDWTSRREDAGWWSLRRPDGTHWHAWRAWLQGSGTMALWLVVAPVEERASLDGFVQANDLAATMQDAWAAALGGNSTALAAMRRWPDYRVTGFERISDGEGGTTVAAMTDVPRRLIPSRQGIALPDPGTDPLPWLLDREGNLVATQAEAQWRVDTIHRPAFSQTIAGYHDHQDAPSTEAA